MNKSKLKEILKYAKQGDVFIREDYSPCYSKIAILINGGVKTFKISKKNLEKLKNEFDKNKIGWEYCEYPGCCNPCDIWDK
jgi:hypothetical protein